MTMLNFGYILVALALLAVIPIFFVSAYLFVLTLFSLIPRWRKVPESASAKFAILIPAHNEDKVIEKSVADLVANMDYDPALYQVVVVADNCDDSTAYFASFAGAKVLESTNEWKKGKGFALEWAFSQLKKEDFDAYLIIDPYTMVDKNALTYLDAAFAGGARAMQLSCRIANPYKSWKRRFMDVALTGVNYLRPRGRDCMGLSCGISGNGLCLTKSLLEDVLYEAFTLVEGLEYHFKMVLSGEKVCFISEAGVCREIKIDMQDDLKTYERSRYEIAKKYLPMLLKSAFNWNCSAFDSICDLYIPSLKTIITALLVSLFTGVVLLTASASLAECEELLLLSLIISLLSLAGILMTLCYIFAGMLERRISLMTWLAVFCYPLYLIKVVFMKAVGIFKHK